MNTNPPRRKASLDGLLVIDKPPRLTSHDVVARVRRIATTKRAGHTGTLDPMATGVLVLCLGKATRLIPYLEELGGPRAKEYEACVRFGFETTTDDAEGEPRTGPQTGGTVTADAIAGALLSFVGAIDQVPPAFSAKKIDGERAYAMARRGEEVELKPVRVEVGEAQLLEVFTEVARIRFACSRGTYIRALARDLGRSLGVGAHLVGLRRLRSGHHDLSMSVPLEDLTPELAQARLIPMMAILPSWPTYSASAEQVSDIRQGRAVRDPRAGLLPGRYRVSDASGELIALARAEGGSLKPFSVF